MESVRDEKTITHIAKKIFEDKIISELQDWYTYTLQDEWQYVVYTVRRSYVLAIIMEEITGKYMERDGSAVFLTDAALFLHCPQMADYFRKYRKFPKVLLCDDIILHGRGINHVIEMMECELYRLLSDTFSEERIIMALADAITVHVYTRTSQPLVLFARYEKYMHFKRKEKPAFWHQLSSDISDFILCANITNASYIFTGYLSEEDLLKIYDLKDFTKTTYQNTVQYTKLNYIGSEEEIRMIFSLRLIKNREQDGYRAAPFVFLPNLDSKETGFLTEKIKERITDKNYIKWLTETEALNGKRTFNEMISLLLSNVVLQSFYEKYKIAIHEADKEKELVKLTRNYNKDGFAQTRQMLSDLIQMKLFTMDEMEDLLRRSMMTADRVVLKLKRKGLTETTKYEKMEIRRKTEDYFYGRGYRDEMSAYELTKGMYYPTNIRSSRRAHGCCFMLTELNRGYTEQESKYCLSYFLQLMDAGVTGLSSYAPNNIRVLGYAQFAKAGEQSLAIEPLRMDEYLPMLDGMQSVCSHWLIPFEQELESYLKAFPEYYSKETARKIYELAARLRYIGQTPADWVGNYVRKLTADETQALDHMNRQSRHLSHYMKYARKKING